MLAICIKLILNYEEKMSKIILVYGLPGSGKSTLANKIFQKLENSTLINGDLLRKKFNDWDFTLDGRLRQANRMKKIASESKKQWVILDFVCPLKTYRDIINPDIKVYMNTISEGRYDDTNIIFEKSISKNDYSFNEFNSDHQCDLIVKNIQQFDWKKETVQMLGRWQPWHDGHLELFRRCLKKTGQVAIQIRDCQNWKDSNPFDFEKVKSNIINNLDLNGYVLGRDYIVQLVPNIVNITYGRKVGYTIEQEHFESNIEDISATKIRKKMGIN